VTGKLLAAAPQNLNLAQLCHDLLRRKSLPALLLSPFQFNTNIAWFRKSRSTDPL